MSKTTRNTKPEEIPLSYAEMMDELEYRFGYVGQYRCTDCNHDAVRWTYEGTAGPSELREDRGTSILVYSPNMQDYRPRCRKCAKAHNTRAKTVNEIVRE